MLLFKNMSYVFIFFTEWSILYVVIVLVAMFVTTVLLFWSIACFCNRICTTKGKIKKYKLVGGVDEDHSMKSCIANFVYHYLLYLQLNSIFRFNVTLRII